LGSVRLDRRAEQGGIGTTAPDLHVQPGDDLRWSHAPHLATRRNQEKLAGE
jgi:hypothetical protein